MKPHLIPAMLSVVSMTFAACNGSAAPGQAIRFDPPSTEFAGRLGIAPPVAATQAMAIAAEAAGGTAVSVSQENEGGQLLFEVQVDTPSGKKEVEIRASDGGVVEIEPADSD
jgi:uncharacterized membrane protein YkoI